MSNKKVILVTGASSGMGKLSAQDLIKAGHTVYAVARSVDKMKDLEALGGHIMKMDVTNEEDIEKVVAQVIAEQGRIDVLWNNAGYGLYGPVEDVSMEKSSTTIRSQCLWGSSLDQESLALHACSKRGAYH